MAERFCSARPGALGRAHRAGIRPRRFGHAHVLQSGVRSAWRRAQSWPTFGFRVRSGAEIRWCNQAFVNSTLVVFPEDGSFEAWSGPGFEVVVVTVDMADLSTVSALSELPSGLAAITPAGGVYDCRNDDMQALRTAAVAMLAVPGTGGLELEFEIARLVLTALDRHRTVLRARTYACGPRLRQRVPPPPPPPLLPPPPPPSLSPGAAALRYAAGDGPLTLPPGGVSGMSASSPGTTGTCLVSYPLRPVNSWPIQTPDPVQVDEPNSATGFDIDRQPPQ